MEMINKGSMDLVLVPCGLAIMLGYHLLLLLPYPPPSAHHGHRLREPQQARLGTAHGADDGAGGDGLGTERDLRQHLGVHDAGVAVHRAGLADRRLGEQQHPRAARGRRQPDGEGEVHLAARLLPRLLRLLHPVRGALRARELPDDRAGNGVPLAGEPRAARGDPGRQLLGAGAPRALLRHGAAHVGVRPGGHARLLRAHGGRAPPARHQLHAAAPPPVRRGQIERSSGSQSGIVSQVNHQEKGSGA